MKETIRTVKFLSVTAVVFIVCYFCFTVGGINRIYNIFLDINSGELSKTSHVITDKKDYEKIKSARMILIGQTSITDIDMIIQKEMINFLSEYNDADCIVSDIANSEAGLLNAFLDTGEEKYYSILKNSTEKQWLKSDSFFEILNTLYNENQIKSDNEKYYWAGISPDKNETAQLEYLKYMIETASENPLNDTIASYLEIGDHNSYDIATSLSDKITTYTGMFKEHFLSKFGNFEYAIKCILNLTEQTQAENFIDIYRDRMIADYIMLLDENMINTEACDDTGFINTVFNELPLFKKRVYFFDSFICGIDYQKIRIVNNKNMKYITKYASFVYKLAGKQFTPIPYKTEDYYIRIS